MSTIVDKLKAGVIYPIPTPFDGSDEVDYDQIDSYLSYLYGHGGKILMTTSGTTKFNLLSIEEIRKINERCALWSHREIFADVEFILGIPAIPDKFLAEELDIANDLNPDAILLCYPDRYYDDDSIVDHFNQAADLSGAPIMDHGLPMRKASGGTYEYTPGLIEKLKAHANIVGIKEESQDMAMAYEISCKADDDFLVVPAGKSARRFLLACPAGAQTYLAGVGSIYPQVDEAFLAAFTTGNVTRAYNIIRQYENPMFATFFPIGWHKALHHALNYTGVMTSMGRKPYSEITTGEQNDIEAVVDQLEADLSLLDTL
jgi:dihydrodipicolinate synthase/N-acetylneuraminate lyase